MPYNLDNFAAIHRQIRTKSKHLGLKRYVKVGLKEICKDQTMFISPELNLPLTSYKKSYQQNSFKDWVDFFLDHRVSSHTKSLQAEAYLDPILQNLDIDALNWLDQPEQVEQFLLVQHQQTCSNFQTYIQGRKQRQSRMYFPTVSHAFEFLVKVAPVKAVDGAWLYSMLNHYAQANCKDLIYIYLEELGLGHFNANHVTLYQQLLDRYELTQDSEQLDDCYYEQAAIQLALAYAPASYQALVIGFNLGYEQLPLHLLITNYELAELGIDPHYFNLHITIDNAHNGHAQKSFQTFIQHFHQAEDGQAYLDWVKKGYALNDLGKSSTQIINSLDLESTALTVFERKALIGQYIHNQKCQFSGKTINEWLANPDQVADFLKVLIEKGWIIKNAPAEHSRFWNMIDGSGGKMFGVFNATEKQIIRDWIQGPALATRLPSISSTHASVQVENFRPNDRLRLNTLEQELQRCESVEQKVELLIPYAAPHLHYTEIGLWATRQLSQLLFPFQAQAMRSV